LQLAETGYNFHFTDASFKKAIMTQAAAPHLSALTHSLGPPRSRGGRALHCD
jgi:hypothetical protein